MGGWIDGVYRQINKRYQKILFHIRSAYFANDLLTLTLQLLRDGICYGFLIYRLAHGTMTVSGFVLMLGAVSGFSSYFNEITSSLSKSVLCLEQIRWMREFLDLPLPAGHMLPFRPEFTEEKPLEICFSHVSFSYPEREKKILDDVSFTLHAGEHTALVGINGAGKTTLIKLLCRLYEPTSGYITLNGIDIRKYNYKEYTQAFSVVFQDFYLFSLPLDENIAAGTTIDEAALQSSLAKVGLTDRVQQLPQGARTRLYNNNGSGVDLSGGEAQRTAIARALYKAAPFVILDEPTAVLDHGRIAEDGTHDTLLANHGIYANLYETQAQYYT